MAEFRINGCTVVVDADEDTPLLWVIRDVIGLTGTKFGCGIGMCGACTVHVGGRPTRSCITTLGSVADAEVTTIEGLDPQGRHPLQKAWIDLQVPQCGYCQSGQIMQAAALLTDFPTPSDQDIDAVMTGNLCRCMTYVRIRKAIKQAAAELRNGAPSMTELQDRTAADALALSPEGPPVPRGCGRLRPRRRCYDEWHGLPLHSPRPSAHRHRLGLRADGRTRAREGSDHCWCEARDQGDVWFFDKPAPNDLHPTMKPVALVERAISNSSKSRDIVLDPFGGSGSTLIAAEKMGRQARLVELDPAYVDTIVLRWQRFSGRSAPLYADGRGYEETASERGALCVG